MNTVVVVTDVAGVLDPTTLAVVTGFAAVVAVVAVVVVYDDAPVVVGPVDVDGAELVGDGTDTTAVVEALTDVDGVKGVEVVDEPVPLVTVDGGSCAVAMPGSKTTTKSVAAATTGSARAVSVRVVRRKFTTQKRIRPRPNANIDRPLQRIPAPFLPAPLWPNNDAMAVIGFPSS